MDVSLLFVNYRSWDHCLEALESVARHPPRHRNGKPMQLEVVVVDNASPEPPPPLLARLQQLLHGMHGQLLRNQDNVGYARAANQACRRTSGRYVVVSNPDVVYQPGTIDHLVHHLEHHADVGAVGPDMYWDDAMTCMMPRNFVPSPRHKLLEMLFRRSPFLERRFARHTARRQLALWEGSAPVEVTMLSGCCFAMRRCDVERFGLFDERYPLYLEDADLALQLRRRGQRLVVVKTAKLVHKFSQSAGQDAAEAMQRFWTSFELFYHKWYGWLGRAIGRHYRRATERWNRRVQRSPPLQHGCTPIPVRGDKPVLPLPRSCERFLVLMSLEPSLQTTIGVFGSGDRWTPADALFARMSAFVWVRILDLTTPRLPILGEYRLAIEHPGAGPDRR